MIDFAAGRRLLANRCVSTFRIRLAACRFGGFYRSSLRMMRIMDTKTVIFSSMMLMLSHHGLAAEDISFDRDIRPLLSKRCFACHGPDAEAREAGLRLDQPDGDEGAIDFAIIPGSIEESEMWRRITSDDESEVMPPPESHLKPLSKKELDLIKRWIQSGAKYEGFWAFEPAALPELPEVENKTWSHQPIDLLRAAKARVPRSLAIRRSRICAR